MTSAPRYLRHILPIARHITAALCLLLSHVARAQTYTLSTIATFNGTGNGNAPFGSLIFDSSGNVYGTTFSGGPSSDGTVFKIDAETHILTTLATFNGAGNGQNPDSNLTLDGSGNLYGTTAYGGANNDGTVFKIAAGTNTITTLATFNGTGNGQYTYGGVTLDSAGNLFGTTESGGVNGDGTVFEIAAGTSTLTTLAAFDGTNGQNSYSGLTIDSEGNLYGTTYQNGPDGNGTVFEIATGTNAITTRGSFNGTNGANPRANLTVDSSGNLYGTTSAAGANNGGTVFKIASGANTITTLANFNGAGNGLDPVGLTLDSNGDLYGATYEGGTNNDGTVFKIAAGTHTLTTLLTFDGTNGKMPHAGVSLSSDGSLYGTAASGGANNDGTVFKLTPTGSAATPEPGALALLLTLGLPAWLGIARRHRNIPR